MPTEAPIVRPTRIPPIDDARLKRIRAFSHFLDQSIQLPFGVRIGFDPLIGLIPGLGDAIATLFSVYLIFESARIGIPKKALGLMMFNVALEGLMGTIPVFGDIFDAIYKANWRNARIAEATYRPDLPRRSSAQIFGIIGIFCVGLIALLAVTGFLILKGIFALFN